MKWGNRAYRPYVFCMVVGVLPSVTVCGYEIDTHSNITVVAHDRSVAASPEKLRDLGLLKSRRISKDGNSKIDFGLGPNYYDLSNGYATLRSAKKYDEINTAVTRLGALAPRPRWPFTAFDNQPIPYFPGDWMARGAVREDDGGVLAALRGRLMDGEQNAFDQLDAVPPLNRFCNHFYDPISNRELQLSDPLLAVFACGPSEVSATGVQWALGSTYADGSGPPAPTRKNGFSVLDAREAMWRALTGTDKQGATVVASTRADRDAHWAINGART